MNDRFIKKKSELIFIFDGWMDGWMDDAILTSFSTVFQSYQGDERLIMKGCVQWNRVYS